MSSISVIIPAYNVEEYVEQAIESVLSQTILPDEIIIINDGSTDNTAHVLERYENNSLFKIFHTLNKGLGEARNRGLKESCSKYVYFFDSDDLLNSSFIEKIKLNIEQYSNPDLIFFSGQSFHDEKYKGNSSFFPTYDRGFNDYFKDSYSLISTLMNQNSFYSSACLYISKKELWTSKNLKFKSIVHEDEDVIFPLAAHSQSSVVVKDVFFRRRIRNDSIMTTNKTKRNLNGFIESLKSMYLFKEEYPVLYNKLKPLWKERVYFLLKHALKLIYSLKHPIYHPVIIKAIYDTFSLEKTLKLTLRIKNKYFPNKRT